MSACAGLLLAYFSIYRQSKATKMSYPNIRGSFLTRSLTPWSLNERERKVDSNMPGKLRALNAIKVS